MPPEVRVVATAGHVDHGKSSLIIGLTGMNPDRFAEEKRRGLTIDLGYAWCVLPSGREIGFVDVPGHERFIRNMLAGVGPVRLVLFVVAADEGWKPQSEEHLQIIDVLGIAGGVVAVTKRDLVDDQTYAAVAGAVKERLSGTVLAEAPVVPVSSRTGLGMHDVRVAIDEMVSSVPAPERARTRLHVDRVFPIKGAGTVVTGTLTGDCLAVGDDVLILPSGNQARIRSLQTHKHAEERACPIARVAANMVGVGRADVQRGDVLARPGSYRGTDRFEAVLRPVRGLERSVTSRGAFHVHIGAADSEVRVRFLEGRSLEPDGVAYARLTTARPLVIDVFDRLVLRDAGRGVTVAGGVVLDVAPPRRAGSGTARRLGARASATREELPALLVRERGAVPAGEVAMLTGSRAQSGVVAGPWLVAGHLYNEAARAASDVLTSFHRARPLEPGAPVAAVRQSVVAALEESMSPLDPDVADALLDRFTADGVVVRSATTMRLPDHRATIDARSGDAARLLEAVSGESRASPPGVGQLAQMGFSRDLIGAAIRAGVIVSVAPDIVMAPETVERAAEFVRSHGTDGVTVSEMRRALGTTRKYAVPLAEHLDRTGVTRREGDRRYPR